MSYPRRPYARPSLKRNVSQRAVKAWQSFASGDLTQMPKPLAPRTSGSKPNPKPNPKPKRQAEAAVSEANRLWAKTKGGRLVRNRRGMMDMPGGGKLPFGLPAPFIQDDVGYLPVRITPSMVGKVLPVLCAIEAKTETGVVEEHQLAAIEELRDANAIAGVARSMADCEAIYQRWVERVTSDQR